MREFGLIAALIIIFFSRGQAFANSPSDMNAYVLQAVQNIYINRAKGGYDINKSFTANLTYGKDLVTARPPGKPNPGETMCVAAVAEVIIEAIRIYVLENHDDSPYQKLPATMWNKSNILSIRPYIFMYADTSSRGTGFALEKFRIGKEMAFRELQPGDFVNLNRNNKTGHAVTLISFITSTNAITSTYDKDVIGFRYFSAQGRGKADAGFAYRDAYFTGNCPKVTPGMPRDCGVIRSDDLRYLSGGRLYQPSKWDVDDGVKSIAAAVKKSIPKGPSRSSQFNAALSEDLPEVMPNFNGETDEQE